MSSSLPVVLSFGASDATGAADLQADQLAVASMGCHPASVVTAVGVGSGDDDAPCIALDEEALEAQAQAVLQNMGVAAFKIGMLADADQVQPIAAILADYDAVPVVFEPRLPGRAEETDHELAVAVRELLVPQASVVVTSLSLARRLIGLANDDEERSHALAPAACARELIAWGAEFVLLIDSEPGAPQALAALYDDTGLLRSAALPRIEGASTRLVGVSDTLSAALAGLLAQGLDVSEACHEACQYTAAAIVHALDAGLGVAIPDRLFWAGDDDEDDEDGSEIN